MKRQSIDKLKVLLFGFQARYEEQKEFFEGVRFSFRSAAKSFEGEYGSSEEGAMQIYFLGERQTMAFDAWTDWLIRQCQTYDALTLSYLERGITLIVEADDKKVNYKTQENLQDVATVVPTKGRSSYIKPSKARRLLQEIGIMSEDGKIKNERIRKYNQIDYFVEVVAPILNRLVQKDRITILDSGCGKSYLTFVLNYYIKEELKKNCHFIGVDYKESVVETSRKMAQRMGYKNMEFICEDLRVYTPDRPIDMVISLHACDVATDYAIALGLRAKAQSMIVVPCCHKELKDQIRTEEMEPMIKHGVFRARFNDLLTDSLRALFIEAHGYEISPLEYIFPVDTPKNLMIRAFKTASINEKAKEEYDRLTKLFSVSPTMEKYVY